MRPNIPQLVYNLALERNLPALRELQAQGHCLTQFHHEFHHEFNAIAKLAFDGHSDAAEFLVDQLIGDFDNLVAGYAHAGNVKRALFWAFNGGDIEQAIEGFAFSGCIEGVKARLTAFTDEASKLTAKYNALKGFAKGQHHALVDQFIKETFNLDLNDDVDMLSDAQSSAIVAVINGYGIINHSRGLALVYQFNQWIGHFYRFSTILTPFDDIPKEHLNLGYQYKLAFLGHDELLKKISFEHTIHELGEFCASYLIGGHMPPDSFMQHQSVTDTIRVLFKQKMTNTTHITFAEHFLPDSPVRYDTKDYDFGYRRADFDSLKNSPYGRMSTLLATNMLSRARQLLQIQDDKKRHGLYIFTIITDEHTEIKETIGWERLLRIQRLFKHTGLGFEMTLKLEPHTENLICAIDFIIVTIHLVMQGRLDPFTIHKILAHSLNITEFESEKVYSHYARIFSKHLLKSTESENTLTQGNNTHAPQHPAAGL